MGCTAHIEMSCFAACLSGLIVDGSGVTGERSGWGDAIAGQEVGDTPGVKVVIAVETRAWTGFVEERCNIR